MSKRNFTAAVVIAGAALLVLNAANAEGVQYPDWSGQWERFVVPGLPGQPSHDQTKPWGFGQQAPLTPEYRKILEDSIADQATGGLGNFPTAWGRAAGMPYMMMAFGPLEWVITPKTTYILIAWHDHLRRHRWTRLARQYRANLCGVLDRALDRRGRRRGLRRARGRDPWLQGPSRCRRNRSAHARGQPDHFQRAHLPRQSRSKNPARRNDDDRQCLDAPLDRRQEIRPQSKSTPKLARVLHERDQWAD